MRAALITAYGEPLEVEKVPDPEPTLTGVVLRVDATGICRSDWHAWIGHENLPSLPHVLGHEMAGTVESVGPDVRRWRPGDRVTLPFSVGCGDCRSCREGHLNTCDRPFTPGFTHWGSFAEYVAIDHADLNLVSLPEGLDPVHAAALGCRFITAFRALLDQGRLAGGEWLAVHGCGGLGLSAVMIGAAIGARVVAIDIDRRSLDLAMALGAEVSIDATSTDAKEAVLTATGGGADVSIDAVGTTSTALNSIGSLRKHGRHVQVGLLLDEHAILPITMEPLIMGEIEFLGSRGMPATDFPRVFDFIQSRGLDPGRLVTSTVPLDGASPVLEAMGHNSGPGVTVIDRF